MSPIPCRETKKQILETGGTGGFIHYSDLRTKSLNADELACYADPVDEVMMVRWSIAELAKRGRGITRHKFSRRCCCQMQLG